MTGSSGDSLADLVSFDSSNGKLNLPAPVSGGPLPLLLPSVLGRSSAAMAPAAPTGTTWVLHPRQEPIRRVGPQLAYNGANGTVVLFGGYICQGANCFPANDTWTFDGTAWRQQHPATAPSARYLASMMYDAKTGQVVLFGGLTCADAACSALVALGDTWTWDGINWTQQSPVAAPAPRFQAGITYDSDGQRILIYGGCLESTPMVQVCRSDAADLWSWDGTNWTPVATVGTPGPRAGAQFAYDPVHKVAVLFSGAGPQSGLIYQGGNYQPDPNDTWTFDGLTWTQQSPATSPEGREAGGMVWDATRQRIVLFGGYADQESLYASAFRQDTWTWDGSNWTQQVTTPPPPRSLYVGFVYDDALGEAILIGGWSFFIPTDFQSTGNGFILSEKDTWTLEATGWRQLPPAEPDERGQAEMAYDPATQRVIITGGTCLDQPDTYCHDTWSWDGQRWTQLHPAQQPEFGLWWQGIPGISTVGVSNSRFDMQVAYDSVRQQTVLYGGVTCGAPVPGDNCPIVYLSDTWTWDGTTWTQRNPATTPGNRQLGLFAFDPGNQTSILFGGVEPDPSGQSPWIGANDTWAWDGTTWTQLSPTTSPGLLFSATMASHPPSGTVVIFGGLQDSPGRFVSDTWTLEVPVQLVGVVSRKVHGNAGVFDINLPVVGPHGVECRSGGTDGSHTLVFSFANTLNSIDPVSGITATATTGSGTQTVATSGNVGADTHQYFVTLSGVPNASHVNITLNGVTDAANNFGDVSAQMDVLYGDVNQSGNVDAADVGQVQRQNNKPLTSAPPANFQMDVNVSGNIDAADVGATQRQNSKHLP